jgi:hypothetical protein
MGNSMQREKKNLGRWARKNLHPFSCLGVLISLLDTHCTIYILQKHGIYEAKMFHAKEKHCKEKSQQR